MGSWYGIWDLLDIFIIALLLYWGVIFRFFRMSALGSQTPSKAACEENDCNQSFMNGRQ